MLSNNIALYLRALPRVFRIIDLNAARRKKCDALMLVAFKAGDLQAVEDRLLKFSKFHTPSTWAITFYIGKIVNAGKALHLDSIIAQNKIRADHLPLLRSAALRVAGEYKRAISELKFNSESQLVRYKSAQAERSLYHQMQDWEGKAIAAVRYIQSEPDRKLLEFSLHAAGSAENAKREDLVQLALSRAISDMRDVKASKNLVRRYWKEASLVSLHIFDIKGAISICEKAAKMGCRGARGELSRLKVLQDNVRDIEWELGQAYRSMRVRAGELPEVNFSADVEVIFHAAAFRVNKIDYRGFRDDIRFCYQQIIKSLKERGLNVRYSGKLLVHGSPNTIIPYFSYHTFSSDKLGLHFKETDRPHSFSFDRKGYSGWASLADARLSTLELEKIGRKKARNYFEADAQDVIGRGVSKYSQSASIDEHLPESFIFVGLQIVGDAVSSLAYMSPTEMIEEVLVTARRLSIPVVVKRHPYCKSAYLSKYLAEGNSRGDFHIATGNIHKLIERSVAVCVVNSAVGAEALLHRKPVFVFGKSEYMKACFVCRKENDFDRQFDIGYSKLTRGKQERFWYYMRNVYAVNLKKREIAASIINERVSEHLKVNGLIDKCLSERDSC